MLSHRALRTLLPLLLASGAFIGCEPAPQPTPPAPPPASWSDVSRLQAELLSHDRGARAGTVMRVRQNQKLAAVRLVPLGPVRARPIKLDDVFSITDSAQNVLANGSVSDVDGDIIVLSYVPAPGRRTPVEGDLAIHLSLQK